MGNKKSKPAKMQEKEEKMKEKKDKLHTKLKGGAAVCTIAMLMMTGCQTADPASRSNRAEYGDICPRIEINGCSNVVSVTNIVGDGVYASADGGGDTQSNTPTQTTDTKPEVAVGVGGGSAGTGGGSNQETGLTGTVLKALKGLEGVITPSNEKAVTEAVSAACKDGTCAPK